MTNSLSDYILSSFEDALREEWIQVYYQPVIRTLSHQVCSMEALARWQDPAYGMLNPDQFIGLLEQHRLIHRLDSYVIRQVCRQIREVMNRDRTAVPISVNLSRIDFELCDIFSVVEQAAAEYEIPHELLYIEITESTLVNNEERMHNALQQFRGAGFQIWMDDFGSGYSTLNVLKDYEFDELKVDMQFLTALHLRARKILTSVVQMAKDIELHTLVEGVETEDQFEFLLSIGCEKVQGYLFGRPMPFGQMISHLRKMGIGLEPPKERPYHDLIGQVNVLSAAPFMGVNEKNSLLSARQLSSISLAIVEKRGDTFSLLFHNSAFEAIARTTTLGRRVLDMEERALPVTMLPTRARAFLEETHLSGEGRMTFISNGDYYEFRAKQIAQTGRTFSLLLQLDNISKLSRDSHTGDMDRVARELYTLFERVTVFYPETNRLMPLYVAGEEQTVSVVASLGDYLKEYAMRWIFPERRADFLSFMELSTMEDRILRSGKDRLSAYFLTYMDNGRYGWKQYILRLSQPGSILALRRDASEEMADFDGLQKTQEATGSEPCPEGLLWRNLVQSGLVNLFWKDTERRFLGVSRGFLDYYGFSSQDQLLGKTDEDMGWHIYPDPFMNDEWRVIREGHTVRNAAGRCLAKGEARSVIVGKIPVYSPDGEIMGLMGAFIDRDLLTDQDMDGKDAVYRDLLTGLLNAKGLQQELYSYMDAYERRKMDFVRIHVSIDDYPHLVTQYGYEHGDRIVAALGKALETAFGTDCVVARTNGHHFVLLHQYVKQDELLLLQVSIKNIAAQLREVDGIPCTIYLSVGIVPYSELEDPVEQELQADFRAKADRNDATPGAYHVSLSSEIFRMYDYLPVDYAAYRVITDKEHKVRDATILYANRKWLDRSFKRFDEVVGHTVRELFPSLGEKWYNLAHRAALLGEEVTENIFVPSMDMHFYVTVNQVVRPGYCAFTYLLIDDKGAAIEASAKDFLPGSEEE